jgi:hypothetical protein
MGDRLVFTDAAGRQLTTQELRGFSGRVRWEIIGADRVPPQAVALHVRARNLGTDGDYLGAIALLDQARALAPGWPYPAYDAAYTHLNGIVTRYPSYAPAWKELAGLLTDQEARLHAISQGLLSDPDPDTRGMLLITQATILADRNDRDTAIAILGDLALSPDSTLATEHLAKAALALMVSD